MSEASSFNLGNIDATDSVTIGNGNAVNCRTNNIQVFLPGNIPEIIEVPSISILIDPFKLREVVELCHATFYDEEIKPACEEIDIVIIPLEEKHKLNKMCEIFWDEVISPDFESKFTEFEIFLKKRTNNDLLHKLEMMARCINRDVLAKRNKYIHIEFQEIIQDIGKTVLKSQYVNLCNMQETIDFVLYYLYSQCLLGRKTTQEKKKC